MYKIYHLFIVSFIFSIQKDSFSNALTMTGANFSLMFIQIIT